MSKATLCCTDKCTEERLRLLFFLKYFIDRCVSAYTHRVGFKVVFEVELCKFGQVFHLSWGCGAKYERGVSACMREGMSMPISLWDAYSKCSYALNHEP